jgi:hypothetical protein
MDDIDRTGMTIMNLPGSTSNATAVDTTTGKIVDLLYSCFGDFEGFVVATGDARRIYRCKDRGMLKHIHQAIEQRVLATIFAPVTDPTHAVSLSLHHA